MKSGYLVIALLFFIHTGFYALPDHWRRARTWLRVAGLLLALVLLSVVILMFVGAG